MGREFTPERAAQGFKSAEHLAAFFAHYDHVAACSECGPGPAMPLDDGLQPTVQECPEAVVLFLASVEAGA